MARLGLPCGDAIDYKGVSCPIKHAELDVASSGDNTLVAAVSGKKILVLSVNFITAGAVNVTFKSGASTDLSGAMNFPANGGMALGFNQGGWYITAAGEALVIGLSGATSVDGGISYAEVI